MEKPPKNIGNTDVQRKLEAALFQGGCFLINHQIQSFDQFLEIDLRHLIEEEFRDVEVLPSYVGTNPTPNPGWRRANLSFQGLQIILPEWTSKEGHASHLFPDEARLRKLTYSAEIQTNIHIKVFKHCESGKLKKGKDKKNVYTDIGKGKQGLSTMNYNEKSSMGSLNGKEEEIEQEETVKNVSIGRIPVMVGSSYCRLQGCGEKVSLEKGHCAFDVGGYFIIKGSEKVLITQEEKSRRLICTSLRNGKGFHARYPLANKGMTSRISNVIVSFKYDVEKEGGFIDAPEKKPNVVARIPFFRPEINAVVLLRALGITSDRELIEIIGLDVEDTKMFDLIRPSLKSAELEMLGYLWDDEKKRPRYGNQDIKDAALLTIKKNLNSRTEESASQILDRCLFPDLGYNDLMKAMHVGYMIEQVLTCCLGRRKEDFSDSLSMRRLELAGDLLLLESKSKLFKFRRDLQRALQKALVKGGAICLQKHIVPFSLENAFSTGNWAQAPGLLTPREGGLVVPLDRANPLATLSHLRQTELSVNSRAKLLDSRYPNLSHLGRFCLVQPSDGARVGQVKGVRKFLNA